jgi:uncharacterized protein YllA (UPF0747 family)
MDIEIVSREQAIETALSMAHGMIELLERLSKDLKSENECIQNEAAMCVKALDIFITQDNGLKYLVNQLIERAEEKLNARNLH